MGKIIQLKELFDKEIAQKPNINLADYERSFKVFILYLNKYIQSSKTKTEPTELATQLYTDWKSWYNRGLDCNGVDIQYIPGRGLAPTAQGYRTKVLLLYPNSQIDVQIVYKGDTISYERTNNEVIYKYVAGDIFSKKEKVGAFCYINTNNENNIQVFETLSLDEIANMRKASKVSFTWNTWEDEMIRKSVIKRACKRLFNDGDLQDMMADDNEKTGANFAEPAEEAKDDIIKEFKAKKKA